ncbi:hypothetical protein JOQ06_019407, partial [Pogonophryne albipinna]
KTKTSQAYRPRRRQWPFFGRHGNRLLAYVKWRSFCSSTSCLLMPLRFGTFYVCAGGPTFNSIRSASKDSILRSSK